jgi:hypothetical protein
MLARHCSQIARKENTLGRHYSRFQPIHRIAREQYQCLAQPGNRENRDRRGRIG